MNASNMTDEDIMAAMQHNSTRNRLRALFSTLCARMERANQQSSPPGIIDVRRMEFDAADRIAAFLRVDLDTR